MNIVVDTKEDYLKWLKDQKAFFNAELTSLEPSVSVSHVDSVLTDSIKK
jgi:hypothetical protein